VGGDAPGDDPFEDDSDSSGCKSQGSWPDDRGSEDTESESEDASSMTGRSTVPDWWLPDPDDPLEPEDEWSARSLSENVSGSAMFLVLVDRTPWADVWKDEVREGRKRCRALNRHPRSWGLPGLVSYVSYGTYRALYNTKGEGVLRIDFR